MGKRETVCGNLLSQRTARSAYIEAKQQYNMEVQLDNKAELTELMRTISQLALKCDRLINHNYLAKTDEGYGDQYGDLQKAVVSMIRGSEIAFEELTGVKYHQDPEDTIPN